MNITAVLVGFLLGALLGALVTSARTDELAHDAAYVFAWFRVKQLWNRNKDTTLPRSCITQIIWASSRMMRLEWIIVLGIVWLCLPALWFVAAGSHWLVLAGSHFLPVNMEWLLFTVDTESLRNCFIGSLVGFLAAPWVWLHFSRDFTPDDVAPPTLSPAPAAPTGGGSNAYSYLYQFPAYTQSAQSATATPAANAGSDEHTNRYRFLTYLVAIALLGAVFFPRIGDLLTRANKVDILGVSVSVPDQGAARSQSQIINLGTVSSGTSARSELTKNALLAGRVGNGLPIKNILSDLARFEELSEWSRDLAYIAYFVRAANARAGQAPKDSYSDLTEYINGTERIQPATKQDADFIRRTAPTLGCLDNYASRVGDFHFYFLDTSQYLKALSLPLVHGPVSEPLRGNPPVDLVELVTLERKLVDAIRPFIVEPAIEKMYKEGPLPCRDPLEWEDTDPPEPLRAPDNATPYPALVAAYSLAAVDSPEAGMVYLSDWVAYMERKIGGGWDNSFARRWYLVRTKIDLGILATTSFRHLMQPNHLISFERRLTDDFASILGVGSVDSWKKLCKEVKKGGLHGRLGGRLAFSYASARNYLFELQTPAVFQSWRRDRDRSLTGYLQNDLDEAAIIAKSENCFEGAAIFEAYRWQWIGQFELNVVQMRLARLAVLPDSEVKAELGRITLMLDVAADHLGPSPSSAEKAIADGLLANDLFDDQRQRVEPLRSFLAQFRPQE
jgi:hypothetical protein